MVNRLNRWWQQWRIAADEAATRTRRAIRCSSSPLGHSNPLSLSGLEPRLLFSATPIDMASATGGDDSGAMVATVDLAKSAETSDSQATIDTVAEQTPTEIIIVDSAVPDIQRLLDDLSASGREAEVFVLDADRDGLDQITEILDAHSDVASIHLVSHGEDGAVKLGNVWLDESNLDGYAGQIASWQAALTGNADILIYGCNLAADSGGQTLIDSISALTGADVAASNDDTGHADFGGDWDLEYATGAIETRVAFSGDLQQNWHGKLATITVDTFADVINGADGLTSLREAVIQANGGGGGDTIVLSAGTYTLSLVGSGENAAATGDLDINQDVTITGAGSSTLIDASGLGDRVFHVRSGVVSISDLHLTGGYESLGGGFRIEASATLNLTDVEIYGNHAVTNGGGVYNVGTLNLDRVTIADNIADTNGGGIFLSPNSIASMTNVTVSGNVASLGGAIFNANANITIVNSTIAANSSGIATSGSHTTQLKNTILDNVGANADDSLTSLGDNIDSDGTAGLGDAMDGFDPLLGALADNGGSTRTHSLLAGSPAIDPGTVSGAPGIDQRGRGRDVSPDVGAYEFTPPGNLTVDTTSDVSDGDTSSIGALLADKGADGFISLREAIAATNNTANGGAPDEISFDIADNDPGHVYYKNDLTGGLLSSIVTTTLDDLSIGDFDPDSLFVQHSWFRIDLNNALPQLEITDAVIINGYTQSGANQNTLSIGNDAKLRIELTNSAADVNRGLSVLAGGAGSSILGLVINDFGAAGILTDPGADNVTIQGNFIGTDVSGTVDLGNGDAGVHLRSSGNQVGGSNVADRNIISGNEARGITTYTFGPTETGNVIENNYIGVDATGIVALGNSGQSGVQILDNDSMQLLNNVIAANAGHGVWLRAGTGASDIVIQGNLVGVGADGTTALGQTGNGIFIDEAAVNTTIGGILAGEGNTIANNAGDGINAIAGSGTSIRGNQIFNNGELGIDLVGIDGVDANDVNNDDNDLGPNGLQNFPVLATAVISGGNLSITGTLDSTPSTAFDFDFFASTTVDASGHGEAERYIGSAPGISTDVNGDLSFNVVLNSVTVLAGEFITATVTDENGNTSEFALSVTVNQPPTADAGGPYVINEGESLNLVGSASSDPNADTLTYAWDLDNDGVFGEAGEPTSETPTVSWTMLQSFGIDDGAYTVGLQVDDGKGGTATETATLTVNNLDPTGNADGGAGFTTNEDAAFTTANVLTNDSDPNSLDVLSVSGLDLTGTSGLVLDKGDGTFLYDPAGQFDALALGQQTTDSFSYNLSDGDGGSASAVVTITINGRNDAATDITLDAVNVSENSDGAVVGNLGVVDPDSGDTHSWSVDDLRFEIVGTQLKLKVGQTLDKEAEPTVNLTITATDQGGAGLAYNEAFAITVDDVNEAPTDITLDNSNVSELTDGAVVGNLAVVDPDLGDAHSWSVDDARFEIVGTQLKLKAGQTLDKVAEPTVSLTITATDQGGAGLSYNEAFVITVDNVNQAPTDITIDNSSVSENAAGAIIGNLGVVDPDVGDTHTWSVDDVRFEIVAGQLKLKAGQTLDHEAEPTVNLTITATDQGGVGLAYSEAFTITVNNVNEAPIADTENYSTKAFGSLVTIAPGVLSGDYDPDGDPLTAVLLVGPANGTLTLSADGSFTYTPNTGFIGVDSFSYEAWDGSASSASTLVTITVTPAIIPVPPTTGGGGGEDDDVEDDTPPPTPPDKEPDPKGEPEEPTSNEPIPEGPTDQIPIRPDSGPGDASDVVPPADEPNAAWVADQNSDGSETAVRNGNIEVAKVKRPEISDSNGLRSRLNSIYQVSASDIQWQDLDTFRNDLLGEKKFESLVVGAAVGVSVAVSVGQAVWALRGYMASTLMTTMPIWRTIDPLPVLEYLDDDKRKPPVDNESLQSIIELGQPKIDSENGSQP